MLPHYSYKLFIGSAILVLSVGQGAYALEPRAAVGIQVDHSDNSNRSASNPVSDTELRAFLDIGLEHGGRDIDARLGYRFDRVSFDENTQRNTSEVSGDAVVEYRQIEDRLVWNFTNSVRNVLRDVRAVDTSDNRENRATTTLSPEFTYRFSPNTRFQLIPAYTNVNYQDSDSDSDRLSGSLVWLHNTSTVDVVGINLNYQDISFDNDLDNYELYRGFVSYTTALPRLNYSLNLGYNEIEREGSEPIDDIYVSFDADYAYNRSAFSLSVVQELTDTSIGDRDRGLEELPLSRQTLNEIDILERRNIQVGYRAPAVCSLCNVGLFLSWEDEGYERLPEDNEEIRLGLNFGYQMSRFSQFTADFSYSEIAFDGGVQEDYEVKSLRLLWEKSFNTGLSISVFAGYQERDSDGVGRGYDEFSGGFSASYRFF